MYSQSKSKLKPAWIALLLFCVLSFSSLMAQSSKSDSDNRSYYIDVHDLGPGVKFADVAGAHKKDLATEGKYDVSFIKYWVDEDAGKVYCLSRAKTEKDIVKTHKKAHGMLPEKIYKVTSGEEDLNTDEGHLFLDIHQLGKGNVTAEAVAGAHEKDLAVESKYGVHFINYWVDEETGTVMCLSQAPDSAAVVNTHKEAHGLLPVSVEEVYQGE